MIPGPSTLRSAFTLIELLVVVAVLAILASIAVPNFQEAQTRAKVARVQSDMRAIATALEAYAVDYNAFPATQSFFQPLPSRRMAPLTTPVAYMTAIPRDPFTRQLGNNYEDLIRALGGPGEPMDMYAYNQAIIETFATNDTRQNRMAWSLASGGPDLVLEWPYYAFSQQFIDNRVYLMYLYDPTNGTTSRGEIFRRGGVIPRPIPGLDNR